MKKIYFKKMENTKSKYYLKIYINHYISTMIEIIKIKILHIINKKFTVY